MRNAHRLHLVRWRDAHGDPNEDNRDESLKTHRPAIYWSAGILVQSDALGVTITQDLGLPLVPDASFTYRTRTFIPRELVEAEFDVGPVIRQPRRIRACRLSPADATTTAAGTAVNNTETTS